MKAALALSGLTVAELAERIPPHYRLSVRTLDRTIQGKRPPHDWEIPLLAELLEVPDWFLVEGLVRHDIKHSAQQNGGDRELRDLLARQHDEVLSRLDDLAETLRVAAASRADRGRVE